MSRFSSPRIAVSIVALVVLGGVGFSATGGNFILGKKNTANKPTSLVAGQNGPAVSVTNNATGNQVTGIRITTKNNRPPLIVNSKKLVKNLNADLLDGNDSSHFVPAVLEAWRFVGDSGEPAFQNGWGNYDTATPHSGAIERHASFRIDNNAIVYVEGNVAGSNNATVMFTLPDGYCPYFGQHVLFAFNGGLGLIEIGATNIGDPCDVIIQGDASGGPNPFKISYLASYLDVQASGGSLGPIGLESSAPKSLPKRPAKAPAPLMKRP